jgi:vancomycin permeability regulator SanA
MAENRFKKWINSMNPGRKRTLVKIILVFVCLLTAGVIFSLSVHVYIGSYGNRYHSTPEDAPKAEAAIVLGALVYNNDVVSDAVYDRVVTGVNLYKTGKVKKVLLTGDHGSRGYDEVNAMKKLALKLGMPEKDIFLDHAGFNTYESMYRAKAIFGLNNALVVTQDFHLPRSVYLARKHNIEAWGISAKPVRWQNPDLDFYNFRELLSSSKAFVFAEITKPKPTFLGPVIPIKGDGRKSWD